MTRDANICAVYNEKLAKWFIKTRFSNIHKTTEEYELDGSVSCLWHKLEN